MTSSAKTDARDVQSVDLARFATMLRERRGKLSLRQAAEAANVSFSTLSRAESGSQPDLTSFTLLCAWLGVPPSEFFTNRVTREVPPIDSVLAHLSSDPRLEPEAATKISDLVLSMYNALAAEVKPQKAVACHLRAAAVLRPGVAEQLDGLLTNMHDELERRIQAGEL